MSTIEDVDFETKLNTDNEIADDSPINQLKQSRMALQEEKENVDNELKPIVISSSVATRMENVFGVNPQSTNEFAQLRSLTDKRNSISTKLKDVEYSLGIDGIEGLNFNKEKGVYELSAPKYTFSAINSLRETGYSFARDANGTMKAKKGGKEFIVYFGPQVESIVKGLGGAFDKMASVVEKYKNADMKDIPKQVIDELRSMADGIGKSLNQLGYVNMNEKGFASLGLMKFIGILGLIIWGFYGGGLKWMLLAAGVYVGGKFMFDGGKDKKGKPLDSPFAKVVKAQQKDFGYLISKPENAGKVRLCGKIGIGAGVSIIAAIAIMKSCGESTDFELPKFKPYVPISDTTEEEGNDEVKVEDNKTEESVKTPDDSTASSVRSMEDIIKAAKQAQDKLNKEKNK